MEQKLLCSHKAGWYKWRSPSSSLCSSWNSWDLEPLISHQLNIRVVVKKEEGELCISLGTLEEGWDKDVKDKGQVSSLYGRYIMYTAVFTMVNTRALKGDVCLYAFNGHVPGSQVESLMSSVCQFKTGILDVWCCSKPWDFPTTYIGICGFIIWL